MSVYVPILQAHVGRFELDQLLDRDGVLMLTLEHEDGRRAFVKFDSYLVYRKRDEGDALRTLDEMRRSTETTKCFYKVEGSDFISWFNAENYADKPLRPMGHYVISTLNDIIDVIALHGPVIEMSSQ